MNDSRLLRIPLSLVLGLGLLASQGCGGGGGGDDGEEDTQIDVQEEDVAARDSQPDPLEDPVEDSPGDPIEDSAEEEAGDAPGDPAVEEEEPLTCGEVIDCMEGCGNDSICLGDCIDSVCPPSSGALSAVLECVGAHCATQCADRTSTACETCVEEHCADQMATCLSTGC